MKYFFENASEYHLICAGSLLGIKLSRPGSFPVGKVNLLNMYPLSFPEFLEALGRSELRELLDSWTSILPFPEIFHKELIEILRLYYILGGMPEVVQRYIDSKDLSESRKVQKEIIDSYVLDFAKHAPTSDIPKLSIIWDSIPAKIPLKGYADPGIYKIYYLDVGLLVAMANIPPSILTEGERLFDEYKGAFVENYVLQQLLFSSDTRAYYWRSEGIAEVDFLIEIENKIIPLEVKSGINPRSKRMKVYMEKNKPETFYRSSLLNLKKDGRILNIPLYAIATKLRSLNTIVDSHSVKNQASRK